MTIEDVKDKILDMYTQGMERTTIVSYIREITGCQPIAINQLITKTIEEAGGP